MSLLQKIQQQRHDLTHRAFDRHIRLGVTGLSGSGKTAFITSLVHQLTQGDEPANLPFFDVVREQRYLGGKLAAQLPDMPRFPLEQNLQYLQQQPPQWPPSTVGSSRLGLQLRYKAAAGLRARLQSHSELALDIIDYPGEWLLDLPLLEMSYRQWCEFSWQLFNREHRTTLAQPFLQQLQDVDLTNDGELYVQQLTDSYKQLLQQYHDLPGAYLNQPGRLLVPGQLAGAPMLQLFPLLPQQAEQNTALVAKLTQHYDSYRKHVIKPFYRRYFAALDRQVILVDCLSALNAGYAATQELQQALRLILQSFNYGPSSLLSRLFKPQISKVLFAASKADHATPEQHKALTLLLQQLLQQPLKHSQYQAATTEAMAIAAIRASDSGFVRVDGLAQPCISGTGLAQQALTYFPGEVPATVPDRALFAAHKFDFIPLRPLPWQDGQALRHVRMDHVLQFLLGDKLR
ncbi:YcjX family protein [Rheinheimera sp. YQF-2]|uniref:YcjX family protein n=1 Tax=Rheinheimera lutimaris TaxID=2740584 RepID=A0A7Y5AU14_9GAMM|nr:YcjX family protein [Rheinheimera lutimaris]NRQ43940.1 YcjX family protein [Rheinheimera lutimaris]